MPTAKPWRGVKGVTLAILRITRICEDIDFRSSVTQWDVSSCSEAMMDATGRQGVC